MKSHVVIAATIVMMVLAAPLYVPGDSEAATNNGGWFVFESNGNMTADECKELTTVMASSDSFLTYVLPTGSSSILSSSQTYRSVMIGTAMVDNGSEVKNTRAIDTRSNFSLELKIVSSTPVNPTVSPVFAEGLGDLAAYLDIEDYSVGDKITITGDLNTKYLYDATMSYKNIDEEHVALLDNVYRELMRVGMNIDIEYLVSGSSEPKTYSIIAEYVMDSTDSKTFDYEGEASDISTTYPFTKCPVTETSKYDRLSFSVNYRFDGTDHVKTLSIPTPEDTETTSEGSIIPTSPFTGVDKETLVMNVMESDMEYSELLVFMEEKGTVDETKASFDSLYNSVTTGDINKGGDKTLIIGAAVAAFIIIGLVAFLIRRR